MLGEIIKNKRTQYGISQRELGELVGVSQPMIDQIERNCKKPSIELLARVADVFNCSTDYLLGRT